MKLIGMLDSPYVRRVAISLDLYGVDFVHEPLSVFRTLTELFETVGSVVKADAFPNLKRHAERLEQHPAFKRYPIE
ncbi:glutathione S-transferase N-terminal domain-containing protein [Pseudomonas cedrina subsp. fulgida]|nr:glutathione S-transferase N-terminal domain-containing protein [Pseudomonas cedrina subsp. fulgida]